MLAKDFDGDLEQMEQALRILVAEKKQIKQQDESADERETDASPQRPPVRAPASAQSPRREAERTRPRVFDAEALIGAKNFAVHIEVAEAKLSRDLIARDYHIEISVRNKRTKEVRFPEGQNFKTKVVKALFSPVWNVRVSLAFSTVDEEELVFDLVDTKANETLGRAVLGDTDPDGWVLFSNPKERTVGGNGWLFVAVSFSKMEYQAEKHATNMYSQSRDGVLDERKLAIQSRPVAKDGERLSIFVGSWNVGNAAPPDDLSPWIPLSGYDVYAIGTDRKSVV